MTIVERNPKSESRIRTRNDAKHLTSVLRLFSSFVTRHSSFRQSSPTPIRQPARHLLRQVLREQRQSLAFTAGQVGADADQGGTCDRLFKNRLPRAPFAGGHFCR